ncbi:MAG: hypothetical protein WDZ54_00095 [Sneathiella sp.]
MEMQTVRKMERNIRPFWFYGLRRRFFSGIRLALVALIFLAPSVSFADVNSVTPTPASRTLPVIGAASFTVTWRINRSQPAGGPATVTVSSANAVFSAGATVVNIGGGLSQPSTLGGGATAIVSFTETLTLTPALVQALANAPSGTAAITRTFTDTQTTAIGTVSLNAGSGNTGALSVTRVELNFDNDSRTNVVLQGNVMRAIANINFTSSGLLQGEWRLIDPTSSLGNGTGRILQVVRRQLVSSGQGRTRIVSPPLPTNTLGLYLLAFTVTNTGNTIETPILRYFVVPGQRGAYPENLTTQTPSDGAVITENTVFSWAGVSGATAYEIQIFKLGQDKPVSGKLVPATDIKLSLSGFSFDNLENGKSYDWRLRAFGRGGSVLGVSPRQSMSLP